MKPYLFTPETLPPGFRFPKAFLDYVSTNEIPCLKPWWFLCKFPDSADNWLKILREWYPTRPLVPFAKVDDTDDIACFDGSAFLDDPIVHCVHSFAKSPYEARGWVKNFEAWLENAKEESRTYKLDRGEE